MSESDGGPGQREVAYRLFAAEFEDADLDFSESDEERAPNYVITPTGARVNRLFLVGVLTEVEPVSDDVLRGRVVDPTGAFVLYAGQYQQDERAFLERAEPPTFVAVTGKARTFQPEDSDRVFTSVRPESISEVDGDTRDRWTVDAAEQTLDRVEVMATAIALGATGDALSQALEDRGADEDLAQGIALALDHYGTTPSYLAAVRDLALDAARVVAGDREEVAGLTASPDEGGDVTASALLSEPVEPLDVDDETDAQPVKSESNEEFETAAEPQPGSESETQSEPETPSEPKTETDAKPSTAGVDTEDAASPASTGSSETDESAPDSATGGDTNADAGADAADVDPDADDGPGDFEPGEFDLDESEREEIEAEYGTEFQSGSEVDDPGEADIETPDPEDVASAAGDESAPAEADQPDATEAADDDSAPEAGDDADVDLEDAVVEAMEGLDEGEGADHHAVVAAVTDRTGADVDSVEDAIQDALMDGRCYEPEDDVLMPI